MKRKAIVLALAIMVALSFSACGKFICEFCGDEKSGISYKAAFWGEEITICKDCHKEIEELRKELR